MEAEAERCIEHLADGSAWFRPDELRHAWIEVDTQNRPAPAAVDAAAVTFRVASAAGARSVQCFPAGAPGDLRDRCRHLADLGTRTDLPPEVVVPHWYERGLLLDGQPVPVLVHSEQRGPVLAECLPQLGLAKVEELLRRWDTVRDGLQRDFGLHHAGVDPSLVHLPEPGVATMRITGWERPPGTPPGADLLGAALRARLAQLTPPAEALAHPAPPPAATFVVPAPPPAPPPGLNARTMAVSAIVMATVLAGCVAGLILLWAM
ncbi:hypothetical protein AB0K00_27385 [Dactylosporangium sp. NPDC049525]|uniref:hypothetical protein n=1 Tax=Dactylosporangium sp. NPDC049525 TaxID=3154730 RepID=UPI003436C4C2